MKRDIKPEACFCAVRLGDKFNKPYILAFATDRTATMVRQKIGVLYARNEDSETHKDGWRRAYKEGRIRVYPGMISARGKA